VRLAKPLLTLLKREAGAEARRLARAALKRVQKHYRDIRQERGK
jgi:hypothetical protein